MFSFRFQAAAVMVAACLASTAIAGGYPQGYRQPVGNQQAAYVQQTNAGGPVVYGQGYEQGQYNQGQYPQLNAPLYPSPVQYVPDYSGGTVITNQAFAPHEMLYSHDYHAMYPPFYHKVKGCWVLTPFGIKQHEKWELQGTEVKVKYRSQYPLFSGFHPTHRD